MDVADLLGFMTTEFQVGNSILIYAHCLIGTLAGIDHEPLLCPQIM